MKIMQKDKKCLVCGLVSSSLRIYLFGLELFRLQIGSASEEHTLSGNQK